MCNLLINWYICRSFIYLHVSICQPKPDQKFQEMVVKILGVLICFALCYNLEKNIPQGYLQCFFVIEPAHEIMVLITSATSEGSGESVHPRSLARAFAVRRHEVWK